MTFELLLSALLECTSYSLKQVTDTDGETAYALLDGCGDQDGDLFYDLVDVELYITNNGQVAAYLASV